MNDTFFVSLLAVGAVGFFSAMRGQAAPPPPVASDAPRGVRNNNPGNVEYRVGVDWIGQVGSDGRYIIFSDALYGVRAMARILSSYARRDVVTLEQIISTWAPKFENATAAYIQFVSQKTGFSASEIMTRDKYPQLVAAIIHFENGQQPYSEQLIRAGIDAGLLGR